MVSEAKDARFGITHARNRPIPTLFSSEACTQTPLDRPKMFFRSDLDFADAPETGLKPPKNGSFRHHFVSDLYLREAGVGRGAAWAAPRAVAAGRVPPMLLRMERHNRPGFRWFALVSSWITLTLSRSSAARMRGSA
jgi:hypothetical protein